MLAQVVIQGDSDDADEKIDAILGTVRAAADEADGLEIAMGGQTSIEKQSSDLLEKDFARIMMVTLVLGLVILLIAFRAVVAALVPLVLAIGSIFVATSIAAIVSQAYPLDESYSEMILLMGMAVGIDYSLFIISRFRSERKAGRPKLDAIAVASDTTGRAVFYAGITVMLSLVGLMMTSNPIFISLALGAIIVVLIALVGSLTLVPAILGILGDNINRLRVPIIGRERPESNGGGFWGAVTDRVLARRPFHGRRSGPDLGGPAGRIPGPRLQQRLRRLSGRGGGQAGARATGGALHRGSRAAGIRGGRCT